MLTTFCYTASFPTLEFQFDMALAFLCFLTMLITSFAALRMLGGEEGRMLQREASICTLQQVVYSFVGKDLASFVEIGFASAVFSLSYWPRVGTNSSIEDIFACILACVYCCWGLCHIWAVCFQYHMALMVSVIVSFLSFLFCGAAAPPASILGLFGGHGRFLLLVSPLRWTMANLYYRHVTGMGSTYLDAHVRNTLGWWGYMGFSLDLLPSSCPDHSGSVLARLRSGNGWICHTGQLFLLGLLFRFIAAVCVLLSSSTKISGGQLSFGAFTACQTRFIKYSVWIFVVFFTLFELSILGRTY